MPVTTQHESKQRCASHCVAKSLQSYTSPEQSHTGSGVSGFSRNCPSPPRVCCAPSCPAYCTTTKPTSNSARH
jgi:hypothetical protein